MFVKKNTVMPEKVFKTKSITQVRLCVCGGCVVFICDDLLPRCLVCMAGLQLFKLRNHFMSGDQLSDSEYIYVY